MAYTVGEQYGAFTLSSQREIEEYKSTGRLFVHKKTKCPVYHLANNDDENLFAFIFRTPPRNSRGTAHIVEHSVLAGSKRYPVKDPFIALTRGSMNTFLNALTYPDKTVYPASSMVKKDFFNLFEVYGDSVFFPLLRKETFHQEGRRYVPGDDDSISVDGVVFNEMKGNYGSHDSIVGEWSYRSLFPDTEYRFDSGGEPEAIRDLSYDEFVDFHGKFYHPSNCRIFLYGNIDSLETLSFLEDRFLSPFEFRATETTLSTQSRWTESRLLTLTSPAAESEESVKNSTITMNWLTASIHDPLMLLSMEILAEILLGHSGAPLQKALVDSGLGEDLSPVSGLDTYTMELVFTVGLRGAEPSVRDDFEALVLDVFKRLVDDGIPEDIVTGAMRRVEFRNREIKGGAPFGLRLMGKASRGWLHDEAPERTLEFEPWMKKVTEHCSRGGYFESLVDTMFLNNPHRTTVIVTPDPEHSEREQREYDEWRTSFRETMSESDFADIKRDISLFEFSLLS